MAAIVNIPFNFQPPTSPSVKTSTYTVPANKYARAILSFQSPSLYSQVAGVYNTNNYVTSLIQLAVNSITINGVSVFYQRNISVKLTDFTSPYTGQNHGFRFPDYFGGEMIVSGYHTTATNSDYNVAINDGSTSGAFVPIQKAVPANQVVSRRVGVPKGGGFCINNGSGAYGYGVLMNIEAVAHNLPEFIEVWLKPGDVINGVGPWQAFVTEYNIPS